MNSQELIQKAREFATRAHGAINQRRKYTNDPYIVHPASVVDLVALVQHTPAMICAAWLHDVVEDCGVGFDAIQEHFGDEICHLVYWVTDKSVPGDGNRAKRKAIDAHHLSQAPSEAQTIKLADIIDNTLTIEKYDPDFAKVYRQEKLELLAVMDRGDPMLRKMALKQIEEMAT